MNTKFSSKLFSLVCIFFLGTFLFGFINGQICTANTNNLRFAQISDAHFSNFENDTSFKLLSTSGELLNDAICQVNNSPNIDFVMFTGDMINKPKQDQLMCFIKYANLLNTPWYAVFGNHDVAHDNTLTKKLYFDILNGHNPNFHFTNPYYSFIPKKGYKVIGLDTIIDYKITSQGEVSEEQLKWLKKELDSSKGDVVIIFTHVPLIEPFPSENHRLKNSYELKLLLKKYDNPIIVCSGHYHATKIFQEYNILYINTPSLVSFPNAFRIINICPHRNKILVDIYLKETSLRALQARAKNKCMGGNMLYGTEQDRTTTIELPNIEGTEITNIAIVPQSTLATNNKANEEASDSQNNNNPGSVIYIQNNSEPSINNSGNGSINPLNSEPTNKNAQNNEAENGIGDFSSELSEENINTDASKEIIKELDDRQIEQKELEKRGKKTKIVSLTNEYIMSLENYLNNPNTDIRLMAAKEVLTRFDEDRERYDDAALNALINKMLQDPSKLIRVAALSALASELASGNDYTVELLTQIQQNPDADPEDVLEASQILLKRTATTEVRYTPVNMQNVQKVEEEQ